MPKVKVGVVLWKMHEVLEGRLVDIDRVTRRILGRDAIITSGREGEHSEGSDHYTGRAIDLRCWDLAKKQAYADALQDVLGDDWFVLAESTHVHLSYRGD